MPCQRVVPLLLILQVPALLAQAPEPQSSPAREGIILPQRRPTNDIVLSPGTLIIHAGVRLPLRLTATLSSDPDKEDRASLVTVDDFIVDNVVIIPKGTPVSFTVEKEGADRRLSPGRLHLRVHGIYTATGRIVIPLRGEMERAEKRCVGEECGFAFATAFLLPWLKGRNASIPRDTLITATVERITSLDQESVRQLFSLLPEPERGNVGDATR